MYVCVYIGMLLCACADCMVLCVHVHVLTARFCVLVHPCVPTDYAVHVYNVMHAYVQAGCQISLYYVHVIRNSVILISYVQVKVLSKSSHRN